MNMIKISIIIPTYNMGRYIGDTLDSIINQKYKNIEIIIVDGGSTDKTKDIILQNFKSSISHFISEPDKGQYDAINKGMKLATGEVLCWINADDIYFPWTFSKVAEIFCNYHDIMWICGASAFIDERSNITQIQGNVSAKPQKYIKNGLFKGSLFGYLQQESMFWRRKVWEDFAPLDIKYTLASDFELWTRFARKYELIPVSIPLAGFRRRSDSRSRLGKLKYEEEVNIICKNLKGPTLFYRLASKNQVLNKLFRLLTWKKGKVLYFSILQDKWILKDTVRPISALSFSSLLLEVV